MVIQHSVEELLAKNSVSYAAMKYIVVRNSDNALWHIY